MLINQHKYVLNILEYAYMSNYEPCHNLSGTQENMDAFDPPIEDQNHLL